MLVRNLTTGEVLGTRVERADSFGRRLRGLMLRAALPAGGGLLLQPCRKVHTHFMRFPIDLLFLDAEGRVVGFIPGLKPWRFSPAIPEATAVLELPEGGAGLTSVGDRLALE